MTCSNQVRTCKKDVSNLVRTLIGGWCNGSTTDSGSVSLGSNPSPPTKLCDRMGKMLLIIRQKTDQKTLGKLSEDLAGYVKIVVDIKRKILAAGGKMHVDGEKLLLEDGSKQVDLWGGGLDLETSSIDFDSMINLRPAQNNPSREVLDQGIRKQIEVIIRTLLG